MEIKFTFKDNTYSICFGYKTNWFEQLSFLTITKEYYDENKEVTFAELLFRS